MALSHDYAVETARGRDFLKVAALDRIAWSHVPDAWIPDGEHVWRVWSDHALLLVARAVPPLAEETLTGGGSLEILGAAVMFPTRDGEEFLHKIMVHPAVRGQGIGTRLMQDILRRATRPVLLTVDPENTAAVRVYEKLGFRTREHIPGYYRDHEHRDLMVYTPDMPG